MQFSVLYLYLEELTIERGRSLGNIDTLYFPHYLQDKENGMKEEDAKDLFRYFYMHFTAAKRFAQQPLTICGSDDTIGHGDSALIGIRSTGGAGMELGVGVALVQRYVGVVGILFNRDHGDFLLLGYSFGTFLRLLFLRAFR